jgi:hypothetical protein
MRHCGAVPGVHEAALAFLAHGVGNELPMSMQKVFPGGDYEAHKTGRKDQFDTYFPPHHARVLCR